MRFKIFTVTLSVLITWAYEQRQQLQQDQQQLKYSNLSIMPSGIDSDMQNSIAACLSIIREYFVPSTQSFMLSTNVKDLYFEWDQQDFLNNLLLNLSMIKVEIENKNSTVRELSFNRLYNLIVVDGIDALKQLDPANFTRNYDIQEYYLVYLMHASRLTDALQVVNEIFAYFWQNTMINVSLLMVNKYSVVEVYTYFPFNNYLTCKMPVAQRINSYSGTWSKPITMAIFPAKIMNLQGCSISVAVWNTPPYLSFENITGVYEIDYFEAKLLKVLANKLNFSLNLIEPPNNEQRGIIFPNGTVTGALKMLQDHTADISLGSFRYTMERSELLTAALPYYQTYQTYSVLRNGQPYTSLEILLYPFDNKTWICLFLSIQIALILLYVLQHFGKKSALIQLAIGCPSLETSLMHVISIFLGQPLLKIPKINLARFMIICWYIYGLLMRTAYQSLLYKLLELNLYHEPPNSLRELIDQSCNLVMLEVTYATVSSAPDIQNGNINVIRIQNTSYQSPYFLLESHSEKPCLAAVSPTDFLTYHVAKEHKQGLFHILPENIFSQQITMYFSKHTILIHRFNELFMNLCSMGLINFWASQSLGTAISESVNENVFTAINVDNLEGVLLIYFVLVSLAGIIFFIEMLFYEISLFVN